MAIYAQNKAATPYMGYYKPVNLYRGREKVAGWTWAEKQGAAVEFENTYNDAVHGMISGHSEQNGTPSPSTPIPIHSAGGCDLKSESAGGIKSSSIAIPILRSLPNGVEDTLTYKGGGMWEHVQGVGVKVFDGTEAFVSTSLQVSGYFTIPIQLSDMVRDITPMQSSHFVWGGTSSTTQVYNCIMQGGNYSLYLYFRISNSIATDATTFKAWLAAQYAAGTPVTVQYQLATPIMTDLNLGQLKTFPRFTEIHQDTTGIMADLTLTARVVDKEAE